ncbi:MAG TPA: TolC family protein, partial [Brumimicrobium sp.]|nr:TolC family protein [Brumimicrobium sp.]
QWQEQQLKTEFTNALRQYEQYVAQFTYFKEQALPNAEEIINAAKLGYSTGDISYVEYLYALQTTADIQLNYLKSIQQINEAVTLINSLISK